MAGCEPLGAALDEPDEVPLGALPLLESAAPALSAAAAAASMGSGWETGALG